MKATELIGQISKTAESVKSDKAHAIPFMDPGDELRQGDLYVTRIAEVPAGAVKVERPDKQLAPGTTQGSRHCLRSLKSVTLYCIAQPGPLDGPVIEARRAFWVDHPEHGNRQLPAGVYAITYQRAFADELRRVQD